MAPEKHRAYPQSRARSGTVGCAAGRVIEHSLRAVVLGKDDRTAKETRLGRVTSSQRPRKRCSHLYEPSPGRNPHRVKSDNRHRTPS